jgi:hypothetical protein
VSKVQYHVILAEIAGRGGSGISFSQSSGHHRVRRMRRRSRPNDAEGSVTENADKFLNIKSPLLPIHISQVTEVQGNLSISD